MVSLELSLMIRGDDTEIGESLQDKCYFPDTVVYEDRTRESRDAYDNIGKGTHHRVGSLTLEIDEDISCIYTPSLGSFYSS